MARIEFKMTTRAQASTASHEEATWVPSQAPLVIDEKLTTECYALSGCEGLVLQISADPGNLVLGIRSVTPELTIQVLQVA